VKLAFPGLAKPTVDMVDGDNRARDADKERHRKYRLGSLERRMGRRYLLVDASVFWREVEYDGRCGNRVRRLKRCVRVVKVERRRKDRVGGVFSRAGRMSGSETKKINVRVMSYKCIFLREKVLRFLVFMKASEGYAWWSDAFAGQWSDRNKGGGRKKCLATPGMTAFGPVEIRESRGN